MADKRINALTTTSASVGDDYFAIDGATNGTRALSAFSPTFGGNATVTGTLSSGGNLSVTSTSAQIILGQSSGSQLTYLIRPAQAGGAIQMVQDSATINRWLSLGGCDNTGAYSELMRVAGATGNILITSTNASTTTSSGALVVGNGTSGGLGVGGAINAGGTITSTNGSGSGLLGMRSSSGNASYVFWSETGVADRGILGFNNGSSTLSYRSFSSSFSTGTEVFSISSAGNTTVAGTLGVGGATVASRLHVYESTSGTGDSNGITIEQASTADAALQFLLTGVQRWTVGIDNSDSDKFKIGTGAIGSADRLTIDTSGNATFAGGLTTGADTSLVAIYVPGDSALRAAAGKLYLDTRTTDGGDIVLRPRTNAALTLAAATGNATFASTTNASSTSFAALVVSGGVGVAKRIVSGEGLTTNGDNETHISFVRNGTVSIGPTSAAAPKLSISSGVVLAAATQSLSAWGDVGAQFAVSGSVLTDTQSSGTVSRCVLNSFASTNVAAAGTTTFTQAATLFVAGAPTAGTNVTITNAYALYTAGGRINFQGLPTSSAGLQAGTLWNDGGTLKVA